MYEIYEMLVYSIVMMWFSYCICSNMFDFCGCIYDVMWQFFFCYFINWYVWQVVNLSQKIIYQC